MLWVITLSITRIITADVTLGNKNRWIMQCTIGTSIQQFGLVNDKPVPVAFSQ